MAKSSLFKILSLFMVLGMALSACIAPAPAGDAAAPAAEEAAAEESAGEEMAGGCNIDAPGEAVEINMIGWTYPIVDFYAEELEKCNDVDNIEVNTQMLDSGSAHDQIRLALASEGDSPYDIIMNDAAFLRELGNEGWLYPLNDLIEKYEDQYNISDMAGMADHSIDGVVYGLPLELNTMHFFYRPDLLEEYGLEVPDTWDDVIAHCGVLADEASIDLPFTIQLHAGWAWRVEFTNMLGAFGGQLMNDDRTPAFNSPEGVQALEKILEIVDACMGDEGLTYSIDDSQIAMATGGLAMAHTWASRAASMDDPEFSDFVGQIEFAPAPRALSDGPHGAPFGGASYSIPANTTADPELLFLAIMEALDEESQVEASKLGIASRAAVSEKSDARYLPAVFEIVEDGLPSFLDPALGILNASLGNWLPKAAIGEFSVQEVLDSAAEEYQDEATTQGFISE